METLLVSHLVALTKPIRSYINASSKSVSVFLRDSQGVWDGHVHTAIFKMGNEQMTYHIAHGTLLNVMWQPGCGGSLGENGYMYVYG